MSALTRIGLTWVANIAALLLAEAYAEGLRIDPEWRVVTAGAVFGVVNWAVKPILRKLAAPLIVLTLGVALFGVNLLAVYVASEISTGFELDDLDSAVTATFWLWLANVIVHAVVALRGRRNGDDGSATRPPPDTARSRSRGS